MPVDWVEPRFLARALSDKFADPAALGAQAHGEVLRIAEIIASNSAAMVAPLSPRPRVL
jgi:hypothetical protein